MNIASIDIGSNTVILLIAELDQNSKTLKNIFDLQFIPRISEDLIKTKSISETKIIELLQILSQFKTIAQKYNCSKIFAIGTNAFRIAENSQEILLRIQKELDINVEVLSGESEAEFSFIGATYDKYSSKTSLVIDIGGGSTEIIIGKKSKIIDKVSLPVGVVFLKEKYFISKSRTNHLKGAQKEIEEQLKKIEFDKVAIEQSIAISGTPTTLAAIKKGLNIYDEQSVEGDQINLSVLRFFIDELSELNYIEIRNKYKAVVNMREDLLLWGSLLLYNIMNNFKIDNTLVSTKGLRYGAIINRYFMSSDTCSE